MALRIKIIMYWMNNIGFVIDSRSNSEDIQDLVNIFLTDAELRLNLVSKGYEYAKAYNRHTT